MSSFPLFSVVSLSREKALFVFFECASDALKALFLLPSLEFDVFRAPEGKNKKQTLYYDFFVRLLIFYIFYRALASLRLFRLILSLFKEIFIRFLFVEFFSQFFRKMRGIFEDESLRRSFKVSFWIVQESQIFLELP